MSRRVFKKSILLLPVNTVRVWVCRLSCPDTCLCHLFSSISTCRALHWKTSAISLQNKDARNCNRESMNLTENYRRKQTKSECIFLSFVRVLSLLLFKVLYQSQQCLEARKERTSPGYYKAFFTPWFIVCRFC